MMSATEMAETVKKLETLSDERARKVRALIDDLAELESLEDAEDLRDARAALKEMEAGEAEEREAIGSAPGDLNKPARYEDVRRDLGLDR